MLYATIDMQCGEFNPPIVLTEAHSKKKTSFSLDSMLYRSVALANAGLPYRKIYIRTIGRHLFIHLFIYSCTTTTEKEKRNMPERQKVCVHTSKQDE